MAIARVQSKTNNSAGSSVATLTLVFDAAPTAGNIIVIAGAFVGTSSSAYTPAAFSTANVDWIITSPAAQGGNQTGLVLAVGRVFASASATNTITANSSGGIALAGAEYSGLFPKWDQFISAVGSSTTPATGASGTTSTANELWIGAIGHRVSGGATFSAPTNSFAIVGQDKSALSTTSDRSVCLLELIASATGTMNAGATVSSTGNWIAQAFSVEESASSGGIVVPTMTLGAEGVAVAA